jgi:drug/metabolite transporter (DMT)-like permease
VLSAPVALRTLGLTALALLAFAANSWICRAALRAGTIDAASFTSLRLIAGAVALGGCALLAARRSRPGAPDPVAGGAGSWAAALALFAYALLFSLAYLALDAGVGALVLFGAVQITMLALGGRERRPTRLEWAGLALAGTGLVVLTAPWAAGAAPPLAAASMAAAGAAWGVYSLRGRRAAAPPLVENAGNFARTVPVAALLFAAMLLWGEIRLLPRGFGLALLSGALTSGLGYAVWYAALPGLSVAAAGLVQLAVPVLAALGGVVLLGERIGLRLLVASLLVLGGIALALFPRPR